MSALAKQTLSSEQEIQAVKRDGKRCRGEYVSFTWSEAQDNRYAISCSKRNMRRAVDRNYFKRINRFLARTSQQPPRNVHLLISARPAISGVKRDNIKQVVTSAWRLFHKQYKKR